MKGCKRYENHQLSPIDVSKLVLKSEVGRRVDVTIENNIKTLDLHNNFTRHFQVKQGPDIVGGFVEKVVSAQLENGYSGFYKEEKRLWNPDGDIDFFLTQDGLTITGSAGQDFLIATERTP
jgi:hypothetical protein